MRYVAIALPLSNSRAPLPLYCYGCATVTGQEANDGPVPALTFHAPGEPCRKVKVALRHLSIYASHLIGGSAGVPKVSGLAFRVSQPAFETALAATIPFDLAITRYSMIWRRLRLATPATRQQLHL
jgi:hypothetical protein